MPSKLGDRYHNKKEGITLEVSEIRGPMVRLRCVKSKSNYRLGWSENLHPELTFSDKWDSSEWTYLGNFSKADNYNNLYDLLNGI